MDFLYNTSLLSKLAKGELGRVVLVHGSNFSGKSQLLSLLCTDEFSPDENAIHIPPDLYSVISGLMPTVGDEIFLHLHGTTHEDLLRGLAQRWGLEKLHLQDPHSLSGGEQVMLVLLCKLALSPSLLALDNSLEQLDPVNRRNLLDALIRFADTTGCKTLIADSEQPQNEHRISAFPIEKFVISSGTMVPPAFKAEQFEPFGMPRQVEIRIEELQFRYTRGNNIVDKFSATLRPGQIYRISGKNGSGKSTLCRLLCGILKPSGGRIYLNRHRTNLYKNPGVVARLHFQSPNSQLWCDSVAKEIHTIPADRREQVSQLSGVAHCLEEHPFDIPYALRKRLSLALILQSPTPWLIFDEPTLGQDSESQREIAACFRKLRDSGRGVILISHNSAFAASIADEELALT